MENLELLFEGYWQCRLATDPDPSDEQRGVSGFTYSIAGETLLEPSIWTQAKDIEAAYGKKAPEYIDTSDESSQLNIKNIREASTDYANYNEKGIGIYIKEVRQNGTIQKALTERLKGALVRFEGNPNIPDYKWRGPIFEGRNQIVSDGDPDRFTLTPFVFSIADQNTDALLLRRFDPLSMEQPYAHLHELFPNDVLLRRLPIQRFAMSIELLAEIGVKPDQLPNYFVNRAQWLAAKVTEAEAADKFALAEAYRARLYAIDFFTQATGPTVSENRLLSRISLRQLYHHTIRGTEAMQPTPFTDNTAFAPYQIDNSKEWNILYYLGAYDGDLMSGWCTGKLELPLLNV